MLVTCSNNFVDGYVGGIQLLCELMNSLCRVLICMWINICPETWKFYYYKKKRMILWSEFHNISN